MNCIVSSHVLCSIVVALQVARYAQASSLVIMTEVIEHREPPLKPDGVSEKVLTDWF